MQKQAASMLSDKQMTLLLAMLVAITPFAVDTYLPATLEMALDLNVQIYKVEQNLSAFVLGVAIGQLVGGSYSDLKGRKITAIIGLTIALISSIGLVFINDIWQLLTLRAVQAFGCGMGIVISASIVRERYTGAQAVKMFAAIGIIVIMVPLIAPVLGAIINDWLGWRAIFASLAIYVGLLLVLICFFLPTNIPNVNHDERFWSAVFIRYLNVFKNPQALGILLIHSLCFANLFIFLTESPFVYREYFGLSGKEYSLTFALNALVMACCNRITSFSVKRFGSLKLLTLGLIIQFTTNGIFVIWSIFGEPSFIVAMSCIMFSVGSLGLTGSNTQALYIHHFPNESGTANAVLGASMYTIASMIGWLTTELHNSTLVIMPSMMFACTSSALILLFFTRRYIKSEKS